MQMAGLERTVAAGVNSTMVEDRLQELLTENNNRQLAAIESRLTAFAGELNDVVRSAVQVRVFLHGILFEIPEIH